MLQKTPKIGSWPPDYLAYLKWRAATLQLLQSDPVALLVTQTLYRKDPAQFIDDWIDTIDPRNAASGQLVRMPFRLFPRQFELIDLSWSRRRSISAPKTIFTSSPRCARWAPPTPISTKSLSARRCSTPSSDSPLRH
jgi:hypothetical protein